MGKKRRSSGKKEAPNESYGENDGTRGNNPLANDTVLSPISGAKKAERLEGLKRD